MKKTGWYIAGGVAVAVALYASTSKWKRILNVLTTFIPSVEGFRSKPYWDIDRYSWGYGTAAPGPNGTITRAQAFAEMTAYLYNDYKILSGMVTRDLSPYQWAAYLSFAYNTGIGNADNLLPNINGGNDYALNEQWRKYVYAAGEYSSVLANRRELELQLWND